MINSEAPIDFSAYRNSGPEREERPGFAIREYTEHDSKQVTELIQRNFGGEAYALIPKDGVDGYLAANRPGDIRHAIHTPGSEAHVVEANGKISGFLLLRHTGNPRRDNRGRYYTGVLAIKRLHVDPALQKQGAGKALFDLTEKRARELQVEEIVSDASGSSRMYFERSGFTGTTVLQPMDKRGTAVIVFAANKPLGRKEIPLYMLPTHVIYAGSNEFKKKFIKDHTPRHIPVIPFESEEDEVTHDVVESASSKTRSAAQNFRYTLPMNPLIVANDVRTDLLQAIAIDSNRIAYELVNRGKPSRQEPLDEILANFRLLRDTAKFTKTPAPYIVRSATYFHSPQEPGRDTFAESDVSIWLTQDALEYLATPEGLQNYRDQVFAEWDVDITTMSGGFALPVFLKRGYVAGINGHPIATIPHREDVEAQAIYTVMGGIDQRALNERFGQIP